MGSSFVSLLQGGKPPVGTVVTTPSSAIAEALALCGYDWLFVDMEHAALGIGEVQNIAQAVAGRCPVVVRIPTNEPLWVSKVLDAGCDGIIVPQVNSAEDAVRAVRAAKYPPQGERSVGIARAHGYGIDFAAYVESANAKTAVIVQIEHMRGVEQANEIAAVDGLAAVFIGPYDLSGSMNLLGQVTHEKVQQAVAQVKSCCQQKRMPVGLFVGNPEAAKVQLQAGFDFVALGLDVSTLATAAKTALAQARSQSSEHV